MVEYDRSSINSEEVKLSRETRAAHAAVANVRLILVDHVLSQY